MTDVGIKIKSITELHLPFNQFPQTPCPQTLCVPSSLLVNEELNPPPQVQTHRVLSLALLFLCPPFLGRAGPVA